MIKVMIADDNININSTCSEILSRDKDIKVVANTFDGESTLEKYNEIKPDVLLLDLELPKKTGLEVIDSLCTDTAEKKLNNIIIITGNAPLKQKILHTSKIYDIMLKPINYEQLKNNIKELKSEYDYFEHLDENIKSLLLTFNFNPYTIGTQYLFDGIKLSIHRPYLLNNINDLYKEISKLYTNTDLCKVKWSIRNSVGALNKHISTDLLHSIFYIYDKQNITPKYFFTYVSEYLKK